MIMIDACEYSYEGTINKEGEAVGHGIATGVDNTRKTWTGTFLRNKLHGKGKNCRSFI